MKGRLGERAGIAALGAFLLIDVVLVAAALNSARPQAPDGAAQVSAGSSPTPSTPGPKVTRSTPSTTSKAAPALVPAPLTAGIVAVDESTAWRFQTGSCEDGGSTLAVTDDGGKTWTPRVAPFDATARVRVRANGTAFAVGGNESTDCAPAIRQSDGDAAGWGSAERVSDAWYRDLRDDTVVGTPLGTTAKPCGKAAVIDLNVTDDGAAVLCNDGRLMTSTVGSRWTRSGEVEGALALAQPASGDPVLARGGVPGCPGVAVVRADAPDDVLGCADAAAADIRSGQVSLSATRDGGWLLVGQKVFRSSEDLTDWQAG